VTWTDERHAAARARCEAATEGPWRRQMPAFIASARSDLPAALDEIERLRARVTELETAWTGEDKLAHMIGSDRLAWIRDRGHEQCQGCCGVGVRVYGSTSTWRDGAGGCSMSSDVCDRCWGSGREGAPWPSHRREVLRG
jgi:hypothetical protein